MAEFTAQTNNRKFVQQMKDGTLKCGVNINLNSPLLAELSGYMGYDFIMVDTQHSPFNRESQLSLYQAIRLGGSKSFTRVEGPQDRYGIQQALDMGSDGILVPFVRNAQDVMDAVSVAKYPGKEGKEGTRSLYLNLRCGHFSGGGGAPGMMAVHHDANPNSIVAVQIETADAIKNLDEILQVPGLDIAFIGPGDLSSSMGLLSAKEFGAFTDPEFGAACGKVVELCNKYGVVPGMWGSLDVKGTAENGFKFIMLGNDIEYMRQAMAAQKEQLAIDVPQWKPRGPPTDPSLV